MRYADLRYVEAHGHGGIRAQTQMIVIHTTSNTATDEGEAGYASWRPDGTSAHFYSDADSIIQALDTDLVAYGCYPTGNGRSVQFEITGTDGTVTDAELRQVAPIIARECKLRGIPVLRVSALDLRNGVRGICGHADVTHAWGEGDHLDGGDRFPWDQLMAYVRVAAGYTPTPLPGPAPAYPLKSGQVYGDVNGPAWMIGGFNGSERPAVAAIQRQLIYRGCVPGISDPGSPWADGVYEQPTTDAVKRYQARHGLQVDGLVGPRTWASLFS